MPRVVALDLGTANVKASVWNVAGRKATFVERLLQPVPQDGRKMPALEQQLAAVAALLDDNPQLKAAGTVVAASYGGRHVSVHKVTLPFTDKKQIAKTLPFAIEAEVPFDLDDMVMGWRLLPAEEGTQALVALAEETALRATLEGLGAHQLEPRQVAADKELLTRWALPSEPLPPGTPSPVVAVLDVGHSRTVVTAVHNGQLIGSRVIDLGGADVTRAIQRGLACSWANAERLKHGEHPLPDPEISPDDAEPGPVDADLVPDEEDDDDTDTNPVPKLPGYTPWDQLPEPGLANLPRAVQEDVRKVIGRQLAEIRSTLLGFEDSNGVEMSELRLGGGGARLDGLAVWIEQDLGIPVTWAAGDTGEPIPCEYLLADALADAIAGQARVPFVDLRTGALAWRSGFNLLQALVTYGGALVLFFTIAMVGLFAWQSWVLSSQIAEVQAKIDQTIATALPDQKIKKTSVAMTKMRERIDEAKARAQALGDHGVPPSIDLIYGLSTNLPGPQDLQIDVTSMQITPRVLTFDAEVPSYAAADQVEVALQNTERFRTCTKSNEQQRRDIVQFSVSCEFDENGDDAGEEG